MSDNKELTIQEILNLDEIGSIINMMIDRGDEGVNGFEVDLGRVMYITLDRDHHNGNKICNVWVSLFNRDNIYEHIIIKKASLSVKSEIERINPGDFNLGIEGPNLFTIEYVNDRGLNRQSNFVISNNFDVYNANNGFVISKKYLTDLVENCSFEIIDKNHFRSTNLEAFNKSIYSKLNDYGDPTNRGVNDKEYYRILESHSLADLPLRLVDICKNVAFSKEELKQFADEYSNDDEFIRVYGSLRK